MSMQDYDDERVDQLAREILKPLMLAQGRDPDGFTYAEYGVALERAAKDLGVGRAEPRPDERLDDNAIQATAEAIAAERGTKIHAARYDQLAELYSAAEKRLRTAWDTAEVVYAAAEADPGIRSRLTDVILAQQHVETDLSKQEDAWARFKAENERISAELDRIEAAWSQLRGDSVRLVN